MNPRKLIVYAAVSLVLVGAIWLLTQRGQGEPRGARGKSPAQTLPGDLTPEQQLAQDLALSDPRVQTLTTGRRSEVMGIKRVGMHFPKSSRACAQADCRQVEIYNFDENAAVVAIVNLDTRQVLDVLYQPGVHPGINQRLAARAVEIVRAAPEVAQILGAVPAENEITLMEGDLPGSSCDGRNLCVAATFILGDRILLAFVDLTTETFAGITWSPIPKERGRALPFTSDGCPQPGTVNRDGWSLSYETTASDGLRVFDVTYNGAAVLTSVKLVEWHVDYGDWGFRDSTGCGDGGGGFPIPPYGETQVLDLFENGAYAGFEVVQDFRMSNWGDICNYRYQQRIQFFSDGRFRIVAGAFGKGCGTVSTYRPVVRIDIAVDGDDNDNFSYWDGDQWVALTTEDYLVPYDQPGHGPHQPWGAFPWRLDDAGGSGYYIEMDTGQWDGENGRGDSPFLYATLHNPAEGDTDLGVIGACCNDDHQQGPEQYINGESIANANLVLWYISQSETDAVLDETGYYCWTVSDEPPPQTYPCYTGPMFYPLSLLPTGALTGTVRLQGRTVYSGTTILAVSNGITFTDQTNADGAFGLPLVAGSYSLAIEMDGYLDAFTTLTITQNTTATLSTVTLLAGDVNDDDVIDILDASFVAARFGLTCGDPAWDPRADLLADCVIDSQDLNLIESNFLQTSPVPWP